MSLCAIGTPDKGLSLKSSKLLSIRSALPKASFSKWFMKIFNLSSFIFANESFTASLADIFFALKLSLSSLKFIL